MWKKTDRPSQPTGNDAIYQSKGEHQNENAPDDEKEASYLAAPLVYLTRFCLFNPIRVLVLGIALAIIAGLLTATQLKFKTSRLDLINQKSDFNKLWIDYIEDFGDEDDLVVVVEGESQEKITPVLDELSAKIKSYPALFRAVLHEVDTAPLLRKGLHFVEDRGQLEGIYQFALLGSQFAGGHWEFLRADAFLGGLCQKMSGRFNLSGISSQMSGGMPEGMPGETAEGISAGMAGEFPGGIPDAETLSESEIARLKELAVSQGIDPNAVDSRALSPNNLGQNNPNSNIPSQNNPLQNASAVPTPPNPTEMKETFRELTAFCDSLTDVFSARPTYNVSPIPPLQAMGSLKSEYFIADEGKMGVVLLKIAESKEGSFTYGTKSIEKLREIIRDCHSRHPETQIGLTGLTVMENDEMRISQEGSTKATILSLFGVALIFILAFGGIRHPMIAVAALVIGIGWTMGYILWSVGHLNILTMSFGVILVGLGIDFGIHYVFRYLEVRGQGFDPAEALLKTSGAVGPGVLTGAITTAAAFFMVGLSEFTGIAELGIISGGGILLCCLAALLLIPVMIFLSDGNHPERQPGRQVNLGSWLVPVFAFPKTFLFLGILITLYLAAGLPKLRYDHNLLNMQPEHLESVELEEKLLKKWDKGAWFALSIADSPEELLERKNAFEADPTLKVDEIISRFPKPTPEKEALIQKIGQTLAQLPERPGMIPPCGQTELGGLLAQTETLVETQGKTYLNPEERQRLLRELAGLRQAFRCLSADEFTRRISIFQQRLAGELLGRLHLIRLTSSPEAPELSDLPEELVSRYVGKKSGKYLMRIYSTHQIWDMDQLSDFVARVKKVDPQATGNPIQTYEASLQMQRSYRMASFYAFLVILPVLYFDFRSVKFTLLALFPLFIGMVWAFGGMGILGIPFNPANTIVLPLIFGIGVDDGVHIVHDFRRQMSSPGPYRMTPSLVNAAFLTTLTTIIGFGSLMIADHRGLQSLGRVLVIGVASCMVVSLTLLPALLVYFSRREEKRQRG